MADLTETTESVDFRPRLAGRGQVAPEVPPLHGPAKLTRIRIIRRLLFLLLFLVLVDQAILRLVPTGELDFDRVFRLPRNREFATLPLYVDHIRDVKLADPRLEVIVFLGSSPTYGHRIRSAANTYPYAYARARARAREQSRAPADDSQATVPRVYNLASNGQLISDQYYIAEALVDTADVFFVQLNYHTFDPGPLAETAMRYPELPRALGQTLDVQEADRLGTAPSQPSEVNVAIQRFLSRNWALYRKTDVLTWRMLGTTPELFLYRRLREPRSTSRTHQESAAGAEEALLGGSESVPFDDLDPLQQMVILDRYAEQSSFTVRSGNSELFFLGRLAALLRSRSKKAVFFMAPINIDVVRENELIDPVRYRHNVAAIARPIRRQGFPFMDYNRLAWLGRQHFFDVSHTLDSGGKLVGQRLYRDTAGYLRGAP